MIYYAEIKNFLRQRMAGSYTVEAAGVFSIILFTLLILLDEAFAIRTETEGKLSVYEQVEYERHLISNAGEKEISESKKGQGWSVTVTLPVFRPEDSLRKWSLPEEDK